MRAGTSPEDEDRPTLGDRLRQAFLKPVDPASVPPAPAPRSAAELEVVVRAADDKERAIGLLAAPVGAALAVLTTSALISNDPKSGRQHVPVAVYHELLIALMVLALAMLAFSMMRKRLLLGVAMALFGLALFNMHYWGFGVPFLIAGSWYLVRAYRLQREWREATGDLGGRPSSSRSPRPAGPRGARPGSSGRYTPPNASRRRRKR